MVKDPICGMEITNKKIAFEFEGREFLFCSKGCLEKFKNSPKDFSQKYIYDLVIIGAGPAGLTVAVYASVLKMDTFLITKDIGGQAVDGTKIKNYMGFDFVSGKELVKKFKNQFLHEHYLAHKIDDVVKICLRDKEFEILTKEKTIIIARAIIIATGMKRKKLGIPGEERLLRKGVSYSAVQDMALFKDLDVVVAGGGNSGVQTAYELKNIASKINLISKGKLIADQCDIDKLRKESSIDIFENYDLIKIEGKDRVEGVVVQSYENSEIRYISCRGVFIQVGFIPNTEFCSGIVKLNEKGEIVIKPDCSTSLEGIFACGDVTNCFGKRIVIASGEGAKAALSAKKYLSVSESN